MYGVFDQFYLPNPKDPPQSLRFSLWIFSVFSVLKALRCPRKSFNTEDTEKSGGHKKRAADTGILRSLRQGDQCEGAG